MGRRDSQGPLFPYLGERERFRFPEPSPDSEGLVGIGGNLSPGMLLSAYEQGVFPWFNPGDPILWHSPDPRFVLFPESLHVSSSMRKVLRSQRFHVSFDTDFSSVIRSCSTVDRPGQGGTWITDSMIAAYGELHRLGWAHSAEAYLDGSLVGGCYGIRLGDVFFGESMFHRVPNASKAAFLTLAERLFTEGVRFIDCQVRTDHLASLGASDIPRDEFLALLESALLVRSDGSVASDTFGISDRADHRGSWTG